MRKEKEKNECYMANFLSYNILKKIFFKGNERIRLSIWNYLMN